MDARRLTIKDCQLYLGDAYEILADISGADAVITDPPYGCTKNNWDRELDFARFWPLAKAAAKRNAAFCVFCQMPFAGRLWQSNQADFRYEWIYAKPMHTDFLNAHWRPLKKHELIYIFSETTPPPYNPQKTSGKSYVAISKARLDDNYGKRSKSYIHVNSGDRFPTTLIDIKPEPEFYRSISKRHPTQKSVAALSFLIKTYANHGDTVLDPFMGSGSTGVAAVRHGRKFIGIEQDPYWFDVAAARIKAEYDKRGLLDMASPRQETLYESL